MKYQQIQNIGAALAPLLLAAGGPAPSVSASSAAPMAPLPAELEALVPSLAARRLSVPDFTRSRHAWADFHGYRKLEVRVRRLHREGTWARVDFDRTREGRSVPGETFRMAWNEGEQGPAPFAANQRLWIWVSPNGCVDGFELGMAVHRWRHQADGTVELQVLDEMVDGGTVLVRMVPDRYSGSEVGKTVYWKGEGLCTGAAGAVPRALQVHPEDLAAAETALGPDGRKTAWVTPGMTSCEDEIRLLLRDLAGGGVVADAQVRGGAEQPFKIRLRTEPPTKKASERPAARGGSAWGRSTAPAARKSSGDKLDVNSALSGLFGGKPDKKKDGKPGTAENTSAKPQDEAALAAGATPKPETSAAAGANPVPGPAQTGPPQQLTQGPQPQAPAQQAAPPPAPERPRFDERWFEVLREKALQHRRQALEQLNGSRSPGSAVSRSWVDVKYKNGSGEPLLADAASLPLVPARQFVPEARPMP